MLAPHPELLATRFGNKLLIPDRIDCTIAIEVRDSDGKLVIANLRFSDLGRRTLQDINDEMKSRLRQAKRSAHCPQMSEGFPYVSRWAPPRLAKRLKRLRACDPRMRHARAMSNACVHLSSTTSWLNGKNCWGVRLYSTTSLGITLAGLSRRPVVVENDQIVVHTCLDTAIHFDHVIIDGAPATRFAAALADEVESGRILSEFPITPRARKSSP